MTQTMILDRESIVRKDDGQLVFLGMTQALRDAVERCNAHTQSEDDLAALAEVPVWDEDVQPIFEILPAKIRHFA